MTLTTNQVKTFNEEGLLCIPDFLTSEQVSALLGRSKQLLKEFDYENHSKLQFGVEEDAHIGDQYFFDSGDKISYFLDTDSMDAEGNLLYPKELAVNKIGHGLHIKDSVFSKFTFDKKIQGVAESLGYQDPRVLQSMCIFKQPIGSDKGRRKNAVPSHNDATFLYTEPSTALGFWFALEDCTVSNGCLSYNPGTHKTFPITKRFVKAEKGCTFEDLPHGDVPEDRPEDYKTVECKAGSLVLIHSSVLHKSEDNVSEKSRFVYAFHLIEGNSRYDEKNWLQIPVLGGCDFEKLYRDTETERREVAI